MHSTRKNAKEKTKHQNDPIILPDLNERVAELAYYKAEKRGFEPGHELNDWLEAEQELIYCGNS